MATKKYIQSLSSAVGENNPITIQILGICSALAVTVQMKTAFVMGLALTFVCAFSNFSISLMRNHIPKNIRIIVELTVISTLVILADQVLKAFLYDISKQLSIFVGLIITNCIIMARAESFALNHRPFESLIDGTANGIGYGAILVLVALIREFFGSGKIFGFNIIPESFYTAGYEDMGLMLLAPGAFIVIGLLAWLQNIIAGEK
jgi:Na+-transporting NADH:ubiquinone oxidoreductase subunit D